MIIGGAKSAIARGYSEEALVNRYPALSGRLFSDENEKQNYIQASLDLRNQRYLENANEESPDGVAEIEAPTPQLLLNNIEDGELSQLLEYAALAVERNKYIIPQNYEDVLISDQKEKWLSAILKELTALNTNQVYKEIDQKSDMKLVNSRWVFNVKSDGGEEKFKARLVCKGFSQEIGINYLDDWAPVASFDSLRLLLALAALKGYNLAQFDATTAFLNGDIDYDIYVRPPPGTNTKIGKVWKLKKSLYSLKQSPAIWYETLKATLLTFGMKVSKIDPCLFYTEGCLVFIYVDDILVVGKTQESINNVKDALFSNFNMKQLDAKMFLDINIDRDDQTGNIKISMNDFITKIEKEHQIQKIARIQSPMVKGYDAHDDNSAPLNEDEQSKFRSLIGTLLHVANTVRIVICYAVSLLSQFVVSARRTHPNAAHVGG